MASGGSGPSGQNDGFRGRGRGGRGAAGGRGGGRGGVSDGGGGDSERGDIKEASGWLGNGIRDPGALNSESAERVPRQQDKWTVQGVVRAAFVLPYWVDERNKVFMLAPVEKKDGKKKLSLFGGKADGRTGAGWTWR